MRSILPRNRVEVSKQGDAVCGVWVSEIPDSQYALVIVEAPVEIASLSFEQIKPLLERLHLLEVVLELQGIVA